MSAAVLAAASFAAGALLAGYSVRYAERHRAGVLLSELRSTSDTARAESFFRGLEAGRVEWAEVERARATHPNSSPLGQVAQVVRLFDQEREQ